METSYNPFSLEGKTILVTGASSGIGKTTAIECSKMGASVIITGRNEERLLETLSQLDSTKNNSYFLADLSNLSSVYSSIEKLPVIDGLVNNAGTNKILPIQFVNETDLVDTMRVNAISPILLTQTLLKRKKINKGGSIVFVSSIAGHTRSSVGNTMYCASKGAISGFVKCLAKELVGKAIRCNEVLPGQTDTSSMSQGAVSESQMEEMISRIPMKRLANPKEIAMGIVFFLSNASSYATGTSMIIDGGLSV